MNKYAFILLLFALTACQQEQQNTTSLTQQVNKKYTQATVLSGVVTNDKGRVKAGQIKVIQADQQQTIATTEVNGHGQYQVEIPANTSLPIILNFHADIEQMRVVVIDSMLTKYDISPLTTAIAQKAKEMGGYTRSNLVIAAENTVHVPDANKTSTGFRGDPTTQYGGWH